MSLKRIVLCAGLVLAAQVQAQSTSGTLVIVPADGEVVHANDQATANFAIEEQDKDKTAAASRVNQKMKQGTDILRAQDPQATFKTYGYYTYAVYSDERLPNGMFPKVRVPTAWRVGQSLEMKTSNLAALPKTTAAAQKVLTLNGINFGLAPATEKKLDQQRIATAYATLNERIASIAAAMGRKPADAVLDTVDFEGSGNYAGGQAQGAPAMMKFSRAAAAPAQDVAEPSFEPGETTLQMHLVGKVKFK
jgi:uncharacterized protein YggE